MKRGSAVLALCAAVSCAGVTFAPPTWGAEPLAGTVAVPDGRYAGHTASGEMVSFKVRHRKIVNPRVSIAVECTHSDGTSIEVMFGPTPERGVVGGTIPRNGVGSIAWVQEADSSLVANATIRISYTFGQGHASLASVHVDARDSQASCAGRAAFRLESPGPFLNSGSTTRVLQGVVTSGGTRDVLPLAGATVRVYSAGASGATVVGKATTNASGAFSVSVPRGAASLYIVARKGSHRTLVNFLGTATPSRITVNELTTVAAAYASAQLARGLTIAGTALQLKSAAGMAANLVSPSSGSPSRRITSSPNGNETNTWRSLGSLANLLAGCVRVSASAKACTSLFALTGGTTSTWSAIRAVSASPANNLKKLYALSNGSQVFTPYLSEKFGPNATSKWTRLDAFTLAVKVNASGPLVNGEETCPFGGPGNLTFDLNGNAWITNNVVQGTPDSTDCIIVLQPNGSPANGTNGAVVSPVTGGGILGQGFGLGFDPSGRLWAGNFGWGSLLPTTDGTTPGGSVSLFDGTGKAISGPYGYTSSLYRTQGTVSDANGNIWLASYGNNIVQVLPNGDPTTTYPAYDDSNTEPFDIRLDANGDAWVSYTGTSTVSKLRYTASGVQKIVTATVGSAANPKGVAVDQDGNAWVAGGADDAVYAFDPNGNSLGGFSGGGVNGPWGVTVDSSGSLWVANFGGVTQVDTKYGVSHLCGFTASACPAGMSPGDAFTPVTGYTLPSGGAQVLLRNGDPLYGKGMPKVFKPLMRMTAAEVDAAGNLWVTNNWKPSGAIDTAGGNPGGDGIVIFVGVAAPVQPKLFNGPATAP